MSAFLKNKGWSAAISPEKGANIDALQYCGNAVYRSGDWEQEPFFQGAAILLPANRTYQGRFAFEGKDHQLPLNEPANNAHLHGSVYRQPFRVTEQSDSAIAMVFENRGEVYPFAFRLEVTYRAEEEFMQEYRITALEKMPLTFALHTAFALPEQFSVPLEACQEKDAHHIPTGRYLPLNEQEQRYVTGSPPHGQVISGYYRSAGQTARVGNYRYEVSSNFDHWILFNALGERDFICIEPQAGAVNGLNNGCCTVLEKGESVTYQIKIGTVK